jgi:hypothetical protein
MALAALALFLLAPDGADALATCLEAAAGGRA